MMKKYLLLLLFSSLSFTAYATEIGLGVSVNNSSGDYYSSGTNINIPINISKDFRVEPFIGHSRYAYDSGTGINSYRYTYRSTEYGVGLFQIKKITEKTNLILGARIGLMDGKTTQSGCNCDADIDGYSLEPVIGFEYYIVDNVSVSAEASLNYGRMEAEYDDGVGGTWTERNTNTETRTAITVRYYLK